MRQALQLRLSQHLALTPQLQQSIRLLQLSTLELNAEIEQALQDNPLLEREELGDPGFSQNIEPVSVATTPSEPEKPADDRTERFDADSDEGWGMELGGGHGPRDPNDEETDSGEIQAADTSLREHLLSQLSLTQLSDRDRAMVAFLIEALNDDGYLAQPLEELLDLFSSETDEEEEDEENEPTTAEEFQALLLEELGIALRHLQHLDPSGVGARSCQECLRLQLLSLDDSPERTLALSVVDRHLEHLAARDFARIKKSLGCDDNALRAAQELILTLNPRPGAAFAALDTRYVVPDVSVRKLRGQWVCTLNGDAMPRLRINRLYADILQRHRGSGNSSMASLSTQLQEAKWLIKNVQQRFDTILRVSQAIVDRQRGFLDHGEVAMRPLTLREIAETVSLHESTISRVTTQKYIASPRGIFELKYFFGSHVATDTGGAASSTAIRALIKQLIGAEDGKKPLSDSRLAEVLGEQGIVVARRTVAKYRELLNIPPVNLRKTL